MYKRPIAAKSCVSGVKSCIHVLEIPKFHIERQIPYLQNPLLIVYSIFIQNIYLFHSE